MIDEVIGQSFRSRHNSFIHCGSIIVHFREKAKKIRFILLLYLLQRFHLVFFFKERKIEEDKRRSLEKFHVFEASLPAFLTALKKKQSQFLRSTIRSWSRKVQPFSCLRVHIDIHATPFVSQVQGKIMMNLVSSIQSVFLILWMTIQTFSLVNDFIHSSLLISWASDNELVVRGNVTAEDRRRFLRLGTKTISEFNQVSDSTFMKNRPNRKSLVNKHSFLTHFHNVMIKVSIVVTKNCQLNCVMTISSLKQLNNTWEATL